ncbi:MAG: riboflavin synthase [Acidobacteria bacterium]|nr:riboflavin synthase [Acidobacteriota bacterium]MYJ04910.1 riboflavin synthase [Acidobacteriota bacterium]
MFTGLIEAVGRIVDLREITEGRRVRIAAGGTTTADPAGPASAPAPAIASLAPGDSIAVNGVCLTAVTVGPGGFEADVSPETLRVTTLGGLRTGAAVNLERPLQADGRLGGHFVQGHVDGVGRIEAIADEADFRRITVSFPSAIAASIVPKGSIAVDGISLTVASLDAGSFDVQIIPYTWEQTNLRASSAGDPVNLECDIIGKYVARAVEAYRHGTGGGDSS